MLKIAVCDDDKAFLGVVETHLRDYFQQRDQEIELGLFHNSLDFWSHHSLEPYNIVWLDVMMPDQTGIDLSRRIFRKNRNCVIAFLSSSPDFALEGYGVNAVRYLLKPPTPEALDDLVERCLQRHVDLHSRSVLFKTGSLTRRVDAANILFLESRNKQVLVHCDDGVLTVPGKLSGLIPGLPPSFIQTHKSYVANLDHVNSMSRETMLTDNGARIPVSRQFHKDVSRRYLDHVAGEV